MAAENSYCLGPAQLCCCCRAVAILEGDTGELLAQLLAPLKLMTQLQVIQQLIYRGCAPPECTPAPSRPQPTLYRLEPKGSLGYPHDQLVMQITVTRVVSPVLLSAEVGRQNSKPLDVTYSLCRHDQVQM